MRCEEGLDQSSSSGGGEKRLNSWYISKAGPVPIVIDKVWGIKERTTPIFFCLSRKKRVTIN